MIDEEFGDLEPQPDEEEEPKAKNLCRRCEKEIPLEKETYRTRSGKRRVRRRPSIFNERLCQDCRDEDANRRDEQHKEQAALQTEMYKLCIKALQKYIYELPP